jgi:HSP20 family protein
MNQTQETKARTELEKTRGADVRTPAVDIHENDKELVLVADLPGVTSERLKLAIEPPELRLEVPADPKGGPGYFRAFTIDERISASEVTAELKNGVLSVHLPKAQALRPRQIPIRTGG